MRAWRLRFECWQRFYQYLVVKPCAGVDATRQPASTPKNTNHSLGAPGLELGATIYIPPGGNTLPITSAAATYRPNGALTCTP